MAHPESAKPAAGPTTEPELESFLNGLDSGDLLLFDNKAKSAAFLKLVQGVRACAAVGFRGEFGI